MENEIEQLIEAVHGDQKDKAGVRYSVHLSNVALRAQELSDFLGLSIAFDNRAMLVGMLHDVMEDAEEGFTFKGKTIEQIIRQGAGNFVYEAVDALTKKKGYTRAGYIERVADNLMATIVKIADLEHNMQLSRLKDITEKDLERQAKYARDYKRLRDVLRDYYGFKDFLTYYR